MDLSTIASFDGISVSPSGAIAGSLATPAKEYAVYLFHAKDDGKWGAHFNAAVGKYREVLTVKSIPQGRYRVEWINPMDGKLIDLNDTEWVGGDFLCHTPEYSLDIVMRMRIVQ